MLIKETITIEREIHVAPCLQCGSTDIRLMDYGYNAPNMGGGECMSCKHRTTTYVELFPKMQDLADIWNSKNDIPTLIATEQNKINIAEKKIEDLKAKLPKV